MANPSFGFNLSTQEDIDLSQYEWHQPVNCWFPETSGLTSVEFQKNHVGPSGERPIPKTFIRDNAKAATTPPATYPPAIDPPAIDPPAIDQPENADKKLNELEGAGAVVAILDTGIQKNHRAFSDGDILVDDKIILKKNFTKKKEGVDDIDYEECKDTAGHGTACAGVACGLPFIGVNEEGKSLLFKSPAPGARLMVCKVGHGNNKDDPQDIVEALIKALQFIVDFNSKEGNNDKKVNVVSISLGIPFFSKDLAVVMNRVLDNDIIVVCCATNYGMCQIDPIHYPARFGHVLCIGACDKYGQPASFSGEGREVDFVELGTNVWVPFTSSSAETRAVMIKEGTSFSTPSMAGLICVLIKDLKRLSTEENLSLWKEMHNVWCMRDLLKSMSVTRGHHDKAKGYGRVIPKEYLKKGDQERIRICKEILGK